MEGKGELHKVFEIACELSAHAEKRSLRPELYKALSYHQNRSNFFTHPRALWAPCNTAPPRAWTMGRSFVLPLALPQIALASVWFEINASACDPAFTSFSSPLPASSYFCSMPSAGIPGRDCSEKVYSGKKWG